MLEEHYPMQKRKYIDISSSRSQIVKNVAVVDIKREKEKKEGGGGKKTNDQIELGYGI